MAKLISNVPLLGTINNMTYYKRRGSDEIFVRMKGGPSREQIMLGDKFEITRCNNSEFGGRATASSWVMRMMNPLKPLADYNIAGPIITLLKNVQLMDAVNPHSQRSVCLSRNPGLLTGFNLNKKNPFDTIIRSQISYNLDRNNLKATLDIPSLKPGINFFVPWNYSSFGLQATLGVIPDLFFHKGSGKYEPENGYEKKEPKPVETDWFPVSKGSPEIKLEQNWPYTPPDQSFSLMLTIGIRYGSAMGAGNQIEQVKYAGAAKVLAMG